MIKNLKIGGLILAAVTSVTAFAGPVTLNRTVRQTVNGANTIQVWEMFGLQNYPNAKVDRIVVRAQDVDGNWQYNAYANLVVNNQTGWGSQTINASSTDLSFNLSQNNLYVNSNLVDIDVNIDGSIYVDTIWVYLSTQDCRPNDPWSPPCPQPQPPCGPRGCEPQPQPPCGPYPNQPCPSPATVYFNGEFGNSSVSLSAKSVDELYNRCVNDLINRQLYSNTRIEVFNQTYNGSYTHTSFCAIAAMNAQHYDQRFSRIVLQALIEGKIPIRIEENSYSSNNANNVLRNYLAWVIPGRGVDDLSIWGERYYNSNSYWQAHEVRRMLENRINR